MSLVTGKIGSDGTRNNTGKEQENAGLGIGERLEEGQAGSYTEREAGAEGSEKRIRQVRLKTKEE